MREIFFIELLRTGLKLRGGSVSWVYYAMSGVGLRGLALEAEIARVGVAFVVV